MIQTLSIDGHQIVAKRLNPMTTLGHPTFLLHGIGGSVDFWSDDQTQIFQEQGPCYAMSLPGHYPATFPIGFRKEQITATLIVELIAKAIHELVGDHPVTLAGLSTGGFTALALAAQAPQIVSRVISISGFHHGKWSGWLGFFQKLVRGGRIGQGLFKYIYRRPNLTKVGFNRQWFIYANDIKAMYAYPHFRSATDPSYDNFMKLDLENMIMYFTVMPNINIREWLPHISAPMLVIAGDHDPIIPPAQARLIQKMIPHAELEMIRGGGHMLFAERPLEYQHALRHWLKHH